MRLKDQGLKTQLLRPGITLPLWFCTIEIDGPISYNIYIIF